MASSTVSVTNTGSIQLTTVSNVSNQTDITTSATASTFTISETAYMYMRPRTITFTAQGLKPNTQYYPFFNSVYVAQYCSTVDGQQSSNLVTNAIGEIVGNFYLPSNTFLAGSHTFLLVDNIDTLTSGVIPNPIYGECRAQYEANGVLKTQQTQVTTNAQINTSTVVTSVNNVNYSNSSIVTVDLPPVVKCKTWYFDYSVTASNVYVFCVVSSSATPPSNPSPNVGLPPVVSGSTTTFVSTTVVKPGSLYYHYFSYRTNTGGSTVGVSIYRQYWTGTTEQSPPSLDNFSPSGLTSSQNVYVLTGWTTDNNEVACPINLGFGTPTLTYQGTSAPYDPLAQSFFIDPTPYPDGVFVTSIALYFKTVDQSTPVELELRNMSNGVPGSTIFPGGRVLVPGYAAAQSPNASISTTFSFDYPVYLQPNNEYCFVVKSPSMGYNAWCSNIGEIDVASGKVIDANPFNGTLFKSENNLTWIPDSYQDLKFDLNIAKFDISKVSDLVFGLQKNTANNTYYGTGQNLPLSYISTTYNSKVIKVRIPFHNLKSGDYITIAGVVTPTAGSYNNIAAADLNGSHQVTYISDMDVQFTSTGTAVASKTGALVVSDDLMIIDTTPAVMPPAKEFVTAVPYINTDTFSPSSVPAVTSLLATVNQPNPPAIASSNSFMVYTNVPVHEASIDYMATNFDQSSISEYISIATGKSTSGSETPYQYKAYQNITSDNNADFYVFTEPRMIATPANEVAHITELSSNPSLRVNIKLQSRNMNVSPVVDINGMSLIARSYNVNNQNSELMASSVKSAGLIVAGTPVMIASVGTTDYTTIGASSNAPGVCFVATGTVSGTGTYYQNTEVKVAAGTAAAKYKSLIITSKNTHNKVSLSVVGTAPYPSVIDAYIRVSNDASTHIDHNWNWMPINGIYGSSFSNSATANNLSEWLYEFTAPSAFSVYDIKLVMRSTSNAIVPKLHSLRTILSNV